MSPAVALDWSAYEAALLALVVWREARGEVYPAKIAVAQSVLNRVKKPGWWGSTLAAVIGRKWQYSSMTAPGDPQLIKFPAQPDTSFDECLLACQAALDGTAVNTIGEADSYYDISISPPSWATPANFVTQIGRLRFHSVRS